MFNLYQASQTSCKPIGTCRWLIFKTESTNIRPIMSSNFCWSLLLATWSLFYWQSHSQQSHYQYQLFTLTIFWSNVWNKQQLDLNIATLMNDIFFCWFHADYWLTSRLDTDYTVHVITRKRGSANHSVMDDPGFLLEHAIFTLPPKKQTCQPIDIKSRLIDYDSEITNCAKIARMGWLHR